MIPVDIPPEILTKTLPELLTIIVAGKYSNEVLKWVQQRIKELWLKKEYGFTPDPDFAEGLQQVSKSDAYKRMKECIGNHKFLAMVKLGLKIEELASEGKIKIIERIKNEVYDKHGYEGIRVLNMGSTGVLMQIIQHLSDLKIKHNYSQKFMADYFDEIINQWKKITIFHKSEDRQKGLERKIIHFMDAHYDIFFVFSIGEASGQAKLAIASLRNSNKISEKGYMLTLNSRKEDLIGKEWYAWVFRNMLNFDRITL